MISEAAFQGLRLLGIMGRGRRIGTFVFNQILILMTIGKMINRLLATVSSITFYMAGFMNISIIHKERIRSSAVWEQGLIVADYIIRLKRLHFG